MPAPTSRSRTVREETTFADERPVQLQAQRRFFSNQGNDRATREARALTNVFAAGTEFINDRAVRLNEEGRVDAITSRGAGEDRAEDEKNKGYNVAWDQLDAEADLNLAMKELPAYLESIDSESLNEEAFQGVISEYMKGQFEGIDPNSAYGKVMAPGLLKLEQELLGQHRDNILESIRADQGQKLVGNAEERIATADGDWSQPSEVDGRNVYEYIAHTTNTFEDGPEKKAAYWDTIYHFAITSGRPELITESPLEFPNGEPTGLKDDRLLAQHDQAIRAATQVQAKRAAEAQAMAEAEQDRDLFEKKYEIFVARTNGADTYSLIRELALMPGVEFADISAAKNFGDSQLDERESRSADMTFTAPLWKNIYDGTAGLEAIFFAHNEGLLGQGPQSEKLMQQMMSTARTVQNAKEALSDPDVSTWRNQINRQYNAALDGPLGKLNATMQNINVAANAFYTEQVAEGVGAMEAYNATVERFDPILAQSDPTDVRDPTVNYPQSAFIHERLITQDALEAVAGGTVSYLDVFAGVPANMMVNELIKAREAGTLTEDQIALIYSNID